MNDPQMDQLNEKVDILIRLIAVGVCGERPQKEKIALLGSAGLRPKLIAEVLGTNSNVVSVRLAEIRRTPKTKRPQKAASNSGGTAAE